MTQNYVASTAVASANDRSLILPGVRMCDNPAKVDNLKQHITENEAKYTPWAPRQLTDAEAQELIGKEYEFSSMGRIMRAKVIEQLGSGGEATAFLMKDSLDKKFVLRRECLPSRFDPTAVALQAAQPRVFFKEHRHRATTIGYQVVTTPTPTLDTIVQYGGVSLENFAKSQNGGGIIAVSFSKFLRSVLARGLLVQLGNAFQSLHDEGHLHGDGSTSNIVLPVASWRKVDPVPSYASADCPTLRLIDPSNASVERKMNNIKLGGTGGFRAPERDKGIASFKNDSYSIGAIIGEICTVANLQAFDTKKLFFSAFGADEKLNSTLLRLLAPDHDARLGVAELVEMTRGAEWQTAAGLVVPILNIVYENMPSFEETGSELPVMERLLKLRIDRDSCGDPLHARLVSLAKSMKVAETSIYTPSPLWKYDHTEQDWVQIDEVRQEKRHALKSASSASAVPTTPAQEGPEDAKTKPKLKHQPKPKPKPPQPKSKEKQKVIEDEENSDDDGDSSPDAASEKSNSPSTVSSSKTLVKPSGAALAERDTIKGKKEDEEEEEYEDNEEDDEVADSDDEDPDDRLQSTSSTSKTPAQPSVARKGLRRGRLYENAADNDVFKEGFSTAGLHTQPSPLIDSPGTASDEKIRNQILDILVRSNAFDKDAFANAVTVGQRMIVLGKMINPGYKDMWKQIRALTTDLFSHVSETSSSAVVAQDRRAQPKRGAAATSKKVAQPEKQKTDDSELGKQHEKEVSLLFSNGERVFAQLLDRFATPTPSMAPNLRSFCDQMTDNKVIKTYDNRNKSIFEAPTNTGLDLAPQSKALQISRPPRFEDLKTVMQSQLQYILHQWIGGPSYLVPYGHYRVLCI